MTLLAGPLDAWDCLQRPRPYDLWGKATKKRARSRAKVKPRLGEPGLGTQRRSLKSCCLGEAVSKASPSPASSRPRRNGELGRGKDLSRATSFSHLVPGCQRRPGETVQQHWSVGRGGGTTENERVEGRGATFIGGHRAD